MRDGGGHTFPSKRSFSFLNSLFFFLSIFPNTRSNNTRLRDILYRTERIFCFFFFIGPYGAKLSPKRRYESREATTRLGEIFRGRSILVFLFFCFSEISFEDFHESICGFNSRLTKYRCYRFNQ